MNRFANGLILFVLLFIFLGAVVTNAKQSKKQPAFITNAKIIDVHDGDTVTVLVQKELKIRMLDCWSPELNEKRGAEARDHLKSLVNNGDEVTVEIPLETNVSRSLTFGRFLGIIYKDIDKDGEDENLSEEMVKSGYATKIKE